MRWILFAILCACGPAAGFLEPCDSEAGCVEAEDFCAPEVGLCTRICRVSRLPIGTRRQQCVPSDDCPGACCLLGAVWPMGYDATHAGSGVCVPNR